MSLRVLGLEAGGSWSNGSSKLRLLRDYLASRPAEQLVCALDGYDVILTGTPGQVLQRYRRFSSGGPSPVVFSSDTVFFSRHSNASACARDYPPSPTMYRFLNSGSLMGAWVLMPDGLVCAFAVEEANICSASQRRLEVRQLTV